jgi:hypothetical protein
MAGGSRNSAIVHISGLKMAVSYVCIVLQILKLGYK